MPHLRKDWPCSSWHNDYTTTNLPAHTRGQISKTSLRGCSKVISRTHLGPRNYVGSVHILCHNFLEVTYGILPPEVTATRICERSIQQFLMIKCQKILEVIYDYGICKRFTIGIWTTKKYSCKFSNVFNTDKNNVWTLT